MVAKVSVKFLIVNICCCVVHLYITMQRSLTALSLSLSLSCCLLHIFLTCEDKCRGGTEGGSVQKR